MHVVVRGTFINIEHTNRHAPRRARSVPVRLGQEPPPSVVTRYLHYPCPRPPALKAPPTTKGKGKGKGEGEGKINHRCTSTTRSFVRYGRWLRHTTADDRKGEGKGKGKGKINHRLTPTRPLFLRPPDSTCKACAFLGHSNNHLGGVIGASVTSALEEVAWRGELSRGHGKYVILKGHYHDNCAAMAGRWSYYTDYDFSFRLFGEVDAVPFCQGGWE
jgi:hypothetical protein